MILLSPNSLNIFSFKKNHDQDKRISIETKQNYNKANERLMIKFIFNISNACYRRENTPVQSQSRVLTR